MIMNKGEDDESFLSHHIMVDWDEDLETFFLSNKVRSATGRARLICMGTIRLNFPAAAAAAAAMRGGGGACVCV